MTPSTWQSGDLLTISTDRFELRSAEREDVTDEILGWLADPEVMAGLNLPRKRLTRAQAVRWVLDHNNHTNFFLFISCRDNGHLIGFYIVNIDSAHSCAETSVVVGNRDFWGKNVVVETRSALLDFLFDTMNVYKVLGRPHGRNFSSIFNYKAMGFTCEAVLREQMRSVDAEGRLDQLIFAIFKSEWKARAEKRRAQS